MGTLRDEVFDNLDYLSQVTEVLVAPENEVLADLPDEVFLSMSDIKAAMCSTWSDFTSVITRQSVLYGHLAVSNFNMVELLAPCFSLEISPDFEIDFSTSKMTGTIVLRKQILQFEEKKLLAEVLRDAADTHLKSGIWLATGLHDKTWSILDTLGADTSPLTSGGKIRPYHCNLLIKSALQNAVLENRWRVRNTALLYRMTYWISQYLTNSSSPGLMNLLKMKFMVDRDLPIYSIDEITESVDGIIS